MVTESHEFAALIKPQLARLYRLAYRLTGRAADAEDLLQDVLVKLYERRDELSSIEVLGPWLGRVLYNQFVDQTRHYARRRFVSLGAAESERSEIETTLGVADDRSVGGLDAFDIREVAAAVAQLSMEHRTVLLMHDAEGYKLLEIQQITGVPVGTLKSRLHRARSRLRELLQV